MSQKSEQAVQCFNTKYNCAQAVFSTLAPDLGLDRETALKIATGFGAGISFRGEVCGAVSGAVMAIGLKYGMHQPDDVESKEACYQKVRTFLERFQAGHGAIFCRDLLGCDLSTPQGYEQACEQHLFEDICPGLVRDAVAILEEIL